MKQAVHEDTSPAPSPLPPCIQPDLHVCIHPWGSSHPPLVSVEPWRAWDPQGSKEVGEHVRAVQAGERGEEARLALVAGYVHVAANMGRDEAGKLLKEAASQWW